MAEVERTDFRRIRVGAGRPVNFGQEMTVSWAKMIALEGEKRLHSL